MDLTPYIRTLRDDLVAAAAVGDEEIRRAATVLGAAIEPATRLAMMSALSDLAAEVTTMLDNISVDLRLDGRDVRVNVTKTDQAAPAQEAEFSETDGHAHDAFDWGSQFGPRAEDLRRAMQDAGGELSRTTVRLFNDLKTQAEQAAADQGVSLNTYISRAVSESVRGAVPPGLRGQRTGRGDRGDRGGRRDAGGHTVSGFVQG